MEKLQKIPEEEVENYTGVNIKKIHGKIKPLKKQNYFVLPLAIGGDAPKDFIQAYIYGDSKKCNATKWAKYIAKVGHKWYPIESINEHLLNRIGEVLDLKMAKSHLVLADNQIRFLSLYFTQDDEELVHGANIFSAYLSETNNEFVQKAEEENLSREWFTFQFALKAIEFSFPKNSELIIESFVKMLMFDAITGNNDRHFYNWGILKDIRGKRQAIFSPIYDSARGLFWNTSEAKIESLYTSGNESQLDAFIEKYMKNSLPKIGWDGKKKINHFQLIEYIFYGFPKYQSVCKKLSNNVLLQSVLVMIKKDFCNFLSKKRLILVEECLKRRFLTLQKICN